MLYLWLKVAVGALLAANFTAPLFTVASNRQLWDEPMAMLAGNLSLCGVLFGLGHIAVGAYDLASLQLHGLCLFLQHSNLGMLIAFKIAEMSLAVDQFVAVVHPLHHYSKMARYLRWLLLGTLFTWLAITALGLSGSALGLQTVAEAFHENSNNTTTSFNGCRWENAVAQSMSPLVEVWALIPSLSTASLFLCTGIIGYKAYAARVRNSTMDSTQRQFADNYRAFKKIAYSLSLTLLLDVVGILLRVFTRWFAIPAEAVGFLHQARLFGLLLEGWVYGLNNGKMREAYKKMFCACRRHTPTEVTQVEQLVRVTSSPQRPPGRIFIVPATVFQKRREFGRS